MSSNRTWKDIQGNSTENSYAVPSSRGDREIIPHLGCSETGILEDCLLVFKGSKSNNSSDHPTEMNWDVFGHRCYKKSFQR